MHRQIALFTVRVALVSLILLSVTTYNTVWFILLVCVRTRKMALLDSVDSLDELFESELSIILKTSFTDNFRLAIRPYQKL